MDIPDVIYLQAYDDSQNDWEGVTWCVDQINDTDVKYVLDADLKQAKQDLYFEKGHRIALEQTIEERQAENERLRAHITKFIHPPLDNKQECTCTMCYEAKAALK